MMSGGLFIMQKKNLLMLNQIWGGYLFIILGIMSFFPITINAAVLGNMQSDVTMRG